MGARTFFSLAFLLPIVVGVLGLAVPALRFFTLAIILGGAPYVLLVLVALCVIWTARGRVPLVSITLVAPLAYVPLEVAYSALLMSNAATRAAPLVERVATLAPIAVVSLATAYGFVVCAWVLWALARTLGIVRGDLST